MARWSGVIGYGITEETAPGVYDVDHIVEKRYKGDSMKFTNSWSGSSNLNDNLNYSRSISIIADRFAYENWVNIRYVVIDGVKWKVTSVDPDNSPRLVLSIGGLYR